MLDNFEHVLAAAPSVADIAAAAAGVTVLVTSRAPLRLSAERVYPVWPLETPDGSEDVERLLQCESVALFESRARAVRPDFAVTPANAGAVADICNALDGLPLAIELAATRVGALPPAALLQRLDHRLLLLQGGARDAPERQRTLRATIDWSYDLLEPDGAAPVRAARGVRRRVHHRGGGERLRRRPRSRRRARVVDRQGPRSPGGHRRRAEIHDAGDDPRVRIRAARRVGGGGRAAAPPRRVLPGARRGGRAESGRNREPHGVARPAGARPRQPPSRHGLARGLRRDRSCPSVGSSALAILGPEGASGGRPASSRKRAPRRRAPDGGPRQSSQRSRRHGAHERRRRDGQASGPRRHSSSTATLGDAWGTAFSLLMFAYAVGQEGDWARAQQLYDESARAVPRVRRRALRAARDSIPCLGVLRGRGSRTRARAHRGEPPSGTRRHDDELHPGGLAQPTCRHRRRRRAARGRRLDAEGELSDPPRPQRSSHGRGQPSVASPESSPPRDERRPPHGFSPARRF